ncbi:hypothetical protein C2G38_2214996 [Gigaspora rosea]|uniref:Uncharacterized protein n=1 Tax=Gigaspora rosea TaxID=44941 RepID=A0A397UC94_9GLOM|nr:hypothetical protein C2G38_2214996 [Gigaspora rosea]
MTEPFSLIINEAHTTVIASWVDRKDNAYPIINNPYEFKFLLGGTRDGRVKYPECAIICWNVCGPYFGFELAMKNN